MKISKKLTAGLLSAALLCSFTGCKEQSGGTSSDGKTSVTSQGAGGAGADNSNTSVAEEQPKEFHEVLEDMAKVGDFNFSTNLTVDFVETTYDTPIGRTTDGEAEQPIERNENKQLKASFDGMANDDGDFVISNLTVNVDESYSLGNIIKSGEQVYVNIKPLVESLKGSDANSVPPIFDDIEYIVITADDVKKYGEQYGSEALTEGDAEIDTEAIEKAFTEAGNVATAFVKSVYEKNKSLVVREDNTYTLSINKSNYKKYLTVLSAMLDDGSLKKFIEDFTTPLKDIPSFEVDGLDDLDATLDELKTQIAQLKDEDIPEFDITYTLTAPKGNVKDYAVTFSATIPDEDGNPTTVKMVSTITPTDNVDIAIPKTATTVDELMQRLEELQGAGNPDIIYDPHLTDPSFDPSLNPSFDPSLLVVDI